MRRENVQQPLQIADVSNLRVLTGLLITSLIHEAIQRQKLSLGRKESFPEYSYVKKIAPRVLVKLCQLKELSEVPQKDIL